MSIRDLDRDAGEGLGHSRNRRAAQMAKAAKRDVRRAHEVKMARHKYPDGLVVVLAIGNCVNINSPNGRDTSLCGKSFCILDGAGAEVAAFDRGFVAGVIKMFPQPAPAQ